jgi:hypothetical protein
VPTFKELGYDGFDDLRVSNGLLAPKGTSQKLIQGVFRRGREDEPKRTGHRYAGHPRPTRAGMMVAPSNTGE